MHTQDILFLIVLILSLNYHIQRLLLLDYLKHNIHSYIYEVDLLNISFFVEYHSYSHLLLIIDKIIAYRDINIKNAAIAGGVPV